MNLSRNISGDHVVPPQSNLLILARYDMEPVFRIIKIGMQVRHYIGIRERMNIGLKTGNHLRSISNQFDR